MMNLTSIKPFAKIALTVTVIFVAVIIITIIFAIGSSKKTQSKVPPTKLNPIPIEQKASFGNELSKIKSRLPYKGTNYSIEYLEPVNIISVKIKATSREQYSSTKRDVEKLIKSFGVADICALNIFWVPEIIDSGIRKSLDTQDYYATGCQPPSPKK